MRPKPEDVATAERLSRKIGPHLRLHDTTVNWMLHSIVSGELDAEDALCKTVGQLAAINRVLMDTLVGAASRSPFPFPAMSIEIPKLPQKTPTPIDAFSQVMHNALDLSGAHEGSLANCSRCNCSCLGLEGDRICNWCAGRGRR